MKRPIAVLVALVLILSLSGCDALQKKFTRKKKAAIKMPRFYQLRKYEKKPSPELYKKHFGYWESWQGTLIVVLSQNNKKDKRCIEEAIGQLKDMQYILVSEKGEEMQPHIETMERARNIIFKGDLSFANKDTVRMTLEKEDRVIKRDFSYSKVRNFLKKGFEEEEGESQMTMAVGKEVENIEPQK